MGRVLRVAIDSRSYWAVLADRLARSWIFLTQLALAATLINPYGLDLLIEVTTSSGNSNLRDVLEWQSIRLIDINGLLLAGSIVTLIVLWRHSRRRIEPTEALLLLMFTAALVPAVRMIGWYAIAFVFALMPHMSDVSQRLIQRWRKNKSQGEPNRRFSYSLICLLLVWMAFALSPISQPLLSAKSRDPAQIYSRQTPRGVSQYLRQNPPESTVWAPQWWGDWLIWDGPKEMRVFMTTNVHLTPRQVWRDHLRIDVAGAGWERTLDRYHIDTLVLDKEFHTALWKSARDSASWKVVYEDRLAVVFTRME